MKKIAVLTSGGDAPGMNAAIRAVVRYGISQGLRVFGIEGGYDGLIKARLAEMNSRSVSDTIHRGGTILKTARSPEFRSPEGIEKAHDVLRAYGIGGLIVIGGDGSFRGIKDLKNAHNFPCVGIPGTIDNDLSYTDFTLGFDTAVNTVLSAINNIRDTMTSHDRACIIEVMGRKCGDIALYSGLAGGAEAMIVPEIPFSIDELIVRMKKNIIKGKVSDIIVLSEGVCDAEELKKNIEKRLDITLRTVKLGYIQRGGMPTMADRLLAAKCAVHAVDLLKEGAIGRVVGIKDNQMVDVDVDEALNMKKDINKELYRIANLLSQ
ncbi:MAG: 6-phosphofructokinase [Clostridia bacterium]